MAVAAAGFQSRMFQVNRGDLIREALPGMPKAVMDTIILEYANGPQGGVYDEDAWRGLKIVIVEQIPSLPPALRNVDLRGKILLYMPQRVRIDGGEEQAFTLRVVEGVFYDLFSSFNARVIDQLGGTTAHGWSVLDKTVIEESRGKSPADCKKMVEARGLRMQMAIETISATGLVLTYTEEQLFGQKPRTYNICEETIDGQYNVVVGGLGPDGLFVYSYYCFGHDDFGVAGALR